MGGKEVEQVERELEATLFVRRERVWEGFPVWSLTGRYAGYAISREPIHREREALVEALSEVFPEEAFVVLDRGEQATILREGTLEKELDWLVEEFGCAVPSANG